MFVPPLVPTLPAKLCIESPGLAVYDSKTYITRLHG